MKFRNDSDEQACGKPIERPRHTVVCLRTSGHGGECIAAMRHAAEADGLAHCCRARLGEHRPDCEAQ